VIHLPKLFVVFLLRQLAEKLKDVRRNAEKCVALFELLVVHWLALPPYDYGGGKKAEIGITVGTNGQRFAPSKRT
jgi:hypothetical protein